MTANDWQNDKYIKNWVEIQGNDRTITNYFRDFPKWLEWVANNPDIPYKTPTAMIESRRKQLRSDDDAEISFWEQQVIKYKNYLETLKQPNGKKYKMATVKGYVKAVRTFFSKNRSKLQFSRGELKYNPSEADMVDNEWIPSNEDVRTLYRLADGARDRAILLTLYQSGFSEVDTAQMMIESFPFYDDKGNWALDSTTDLYRKQRREKTNEWQQTCISREALEEIRIMLQNRGYPKSGCLFVSFRGEPLGVRGINEVFKGSYGTVKGECVKKMGLVEKAFNGKSKLWQTKHLRDAYKNGLISAKLPQEIIDVMFGHRRQGAKNDYAIAEQTVRISYTEAFKFLTINGYGSQNRKIEELVKKQEADKQQLEAKMNEDRDALMAVIKNQQKSMDAQTKTVTEQNSRLEKMEATLNLLKERAISLTSNSEQRKEREKIFNELPPDLQAKLWDAVLKGAYKVVVEQEKTPDNGQE